MLVISPSGSTWYKVGGDPMMRDGVRTRSAPHPWPAPLAGLLPQCRARCWYVNVRDVRVELHACPASELVLPPVHPPGPPDGLQLPALFRLLHRQVKLLQSLISGDWNFTALVAVNKGAENHYCYPAKIWQLVGSLYSGSVVKSLPDATYRCST